MNKKCIGCGVEMQMEDSQGIGYTPKEDALYCQRCFRIRHYNDVTISMKQGIDSKKVLSKIKKLNGMIVWVVDVFDFESNMIQNLNECFPKENILLVLTKQDLLPITLTNEKLLKFVLERLQFYNIQVNGIVICGDMVHHAYHWQNHSLEILKDAIRKTFQKRKVIFMGMANAGKSTLINALQNNKNVTTSKYPGTTLDILKLENDEFTIYDTPGLTRLDSLITRIDEKILKQVIPSSALKPQVYQIYENQSLAVGGLVRMDVYCKTPITVVGYFSTELKIHRGKLENADRLWEQHKGKLLRPTLNDGSKFKTVTYHFDDDYDKTDVVIHGLGWFCISKEVTKIKISVNESLGITIRKAMI